VAKFKIFIRPLPSYNPDVEIIEADSIVFPNGAIAFYGPQTSLGETGLIKAFAAGYWKTVTRISESEK